MTNKKEHCKLEQFGRNLKGKKKTKKHILNWKKSRGGVKNRKKA